MQSELDTDLQKIAWDNYVQHRDKKNRIEALHAASRIAAGAQQADLELLIDGKVVSIEGWTLFIAEQFARYIETGKG